MGNQSSQSNQNNQSSSSTQTQQLAYNVYGQLTQVNATAAQTDKLKNTIKAVIDESYQLDLNGNRLSNQDKNQPNQHYQYQANSDQLLAVKGTHHTKYAYNSLGEPIQIQQQNKQNQLNRQIYYGARGQISRITDNGKPTATYQYNHARQRTHKQTQSQNTYYLWHGGLVDAEIEQSTATSNNTKNNKNNNSAHITKRYIYLGLKPVAVIDYNADKQASIYAIHTDYLGTPQAVTNAKQQVVWRAEYTPFGQIRKQQAVPLVMASDTSGQHNQGFISTANATAAPQALFELNLRFAGQYDDSETGYYYNWHRYYNPETGRYLTPDPIGLQGGANAYAYANHDPAQYIDPYGLVWVDINGKQINNTTLSNVKVYIFHDDDFVKQAKVQYEKAVKQFGAGAVALSNTGTTAGFTADWANMQGDIAQVMIMTHGKNQSISLGVNQLTATGNGLTNKSFTGAVNIQDLPGPAGNIKNATLLMYSCHSADAQQDAHGTQGPLRGTKKPIAQVFAETFDFAKVQGTVGAVNYYYLNNMIFPTDSLWKTPYPEDGEWVYPNVLTGDQRIRALKEDIKKLEEELLEFETEKPGKLTEEKITEIKTSIKTSIEKAKARLSVLVKEWTDSQRGG